jgi:hypothetical protein
MDRKDARPDLRTRRSVQQRSTATTARSKAFGFVQMRPDQAKQGYERLLREVRDETYQFGTHTDWLSDGPDLTAIRARPKFPSSSTGLPTRSPRSAAAFATKCQLLHTTSSRPFTGDTCQGVQQAGEESFIRPGYLGVCIGQEPPGYPAHLDVTE